MPGQEQVVYNEDDPVEEVLKRRSVGQSKLLGWMACIATNVDAGKYTYGDFPRAFVWVLKTRSWKKRERRIGRAIGRITYVPPNTKNKEVYYLRMLLNVVKGATSFDDIKTVNNVVHERFQDACEALKLLDNDNEYIEAIKEASFISSGKQIRRLFALLLTSGSVQSPLVLWNATMEYLCEDILYEQRKKKKKPGLVLSKDQIIDLALYDIESNMRFNGGSLFDIDGMPHPDMSIHDSDKNPLIQEEESYDRQYLRQKHSELIKTITDEQKEIYDEIMNAVRSGIGGMFFVYGFGGTGKTYIWSLLGAALRSEGLIVLNVASSGIAALLLQGGRTAHSRFAIPIQVDEYSTCPIKPGSHLAQLIEKTKLIIWDEAPMMQKHCFETLDRTMRDLLHSNKPFGGKTIVFGGDFRQILPVITNGTRSEIIMATINSSNLWKKCRVLTLTQNMRLRTSSSDVLSQEIASFSKWLLDIGEGKIGESVDGEANIDIPEDLLITDKGEPMHAIVNAIYGTNYRTNTDPCFYQKRAILSPRNQDVYMINDFMLSQLEGDSMVYLSADTVEASDKTDINDNINDQSMPNPTKIYAPVYSQEFLNSIKVSGLPNHELKLKVGAPIMLLRNVDPKNGLCNGTRILISQFTPNLIQGRKLSGDNVGEIVLIPRLHVCPPDTRFPFRMKRKQFPVSLAFAMTINKSQGQTLHDVGIYLPRPVFTHGQLYVALSRVTSRSGLKILITDSEGQPVKQTTNVVYTEVFKRI